MSNKEYEIHTCSDPEVTYNYVKGLYRVAMVEQELKPHDIAKVEKRVEELKNE